MSADEISGNAISRLIDILENDIVRQRVPGDEDEFDRWNSDYVLLCTEGKDIVKLETEHQALVVEALDEWADLFAGICALFSDSSVNFTFWFMALREGARRTGSVLLQDFKGGNAKLYRASERARMVVVNIGWCTAFAYYLPRAIPQLRGRSIEAGLQMLAVFWLEQLARLTVMNPGRRPG